MSNETHIKEINALIKALHNEKFVGASICPGWTPFYKLRANGEIVPGDGSPSFEWPLTDTRFEGLEWPCIDSNSDVGYALMDFEPACLIRSHMLKLLPEDNPIRKRLTCDESIEDMIQVWTQAWCTSLFHRRNALRHSKMTYQTIIAESASICGIC